MPTPGITKATTRVLVAIAVPELSRKKLVPSVPGAFVVLIAHWRCVMFEKSWVGVVSGTQLSVVVEVFQMTGAVLVPLGTLVRVPKSRLIGLSITVSVRSTLSRVHAFVTTVAEAAPRRAPVVGIVPVAASTVSGG